MRIILAGGFLGAGKTTLLTRAAQALNRRELQTAIITNDQTGGLVDTTVVRQNNLPAAEVTQGCFCCNFPDLIGAIQTLKGQGEFDVILAEPVGSCTDLMATVIRPLQRYYGDQFEVAPLTVLLDSARDLLLFPSLVGYLHDKQLAEADILMLNKADLLSAEQKAGQVAQLQDAHPDTPVMALSALTGDGLDAWLDICLSSTSPAHKRLPLDYKLYADAEAALGWLNASGTLTAAEGDYSPQDWITTLMERLRSAFEADHMEMAHLKTFSRSADRAWKASITQSNAPISWDIQSPERARRAEFILNVRVNGQPPEIEDTVRHTLSAVGLAHGLRTEVAALDCFSPLPPKPTYRLLMPD